MSFASDKISSLTARLLGGKSNGVGISDRPEPTMDENPAPNGVAHSPRVLTEVGRENEEVRRRQDSILRRAGLLSSLEDDLADVFEHTSQILDDLERTKAELAKREAIGKFEREANEAALHRMKELGDAHERARSELELLRPEMHRLSTLAGEAEIRIARHEADSAALRDQLADAGRELTKHREQTRYTVQELDAARAELKMADIVNAQRNTDVAEAAQRLEVAEQTISSLNIALAEAQNALARCTTDLEDARVGLDASRNRIANVESEMHDFQQEHTRMRGLWQREADQHRADVAGLQAQLDQATGVGGVHERLLGETRAELQAANDELKRTERRALDAEMAAEQNAQRLSAAEAARDSALADHMTTKSQQRNLVRRVKPLIAALREKQIDARRTAMKIEDLEGRLDVRGRELEASQLNSETRLRALIEELEVERSRRILAEGALGADRTKRGVDEAAGKGNGVVTIDGEASAPNSRLLLGRPRAANDSAKLKRGRRPHEAA